MNEFFALMNRLKYIDRWGLMYSSRRENVMEHSAFTAMLAHALALTENDLAGYKKVDAEHTALLALYHESAEVLTGDLPTPIKYYNDDITAAYKEIEQAANRRIVESLPRSLKGPLGGYIEQKASDTESAIVKAADRIAALIKCKEEISRGNGEFEGAYRSTLEKLTETPSESVKYFLSEILPTFDKTLDELNKK